jgi:ribosomal protein L16 Arg81 hydroxylase
MPRPSVLPEPLTNKKTVLQAVSSLAWLIDPLSPKEFFEKYWEQRPLVVTRRLPDYFSSLITLEEVDRIITTLDRGYPNVILKNANRDIVAADYTVDGEVLDVVKVYQLFAEGSTITLAFLDTVVPALTAFCRGLESEFSFPLQTNIYLTPATAQGAKVHYDTHDVFVLQVAGSKRWTLYNKPLELPLSGQKYDVALHDPGAPTLKFELQAGDVAYIPRGVAHDARSSENVSLHVTAGILRYTWTDLLLEAIANISVNDPAFRRALPPGFARQDFDRARARGTLQQLLQLACATSNFDAALDHFVDEFIQSRPPQLTGQLAQLRWLEHLVPDSFVGARAGLIFRLQQDTESMTVDCYGRRLRFPLHAADAVRFALSSSRFAVREMPGCLDDAGKLVVVRRLIREGLLISLRNGA